MDAVHTIHKSPKIIWGIQLMSNLFSGSIAFIRFSKRLEILKRLRLIEAGISTCFLSLSYWVIAH